VVATALMLAGWAGIARADQLAELGGRRLAQQQVWTAVSLVALLGLARLNYRVLCRYSYPLYAGILGLLVLVFFFPAVNGAHRWIRLGPLGLQPSEFAKVAYVLALSRYLMYRRSQRQMLGLIIPLLLTAVPVVLILREPDLGTASLFLPLWMLMLVVAGARLPHLALAATVGALLLPVLWLQMSREQRSRVTTWLQQSDTAESPAADGYHLHRAKQMVALGGPLGSWVGSEVSDDVTALHVPEGATDSVFVVLAERFGWLGISGLLFLFSLLVWRAMTIAEATREPFGRLVAAGIGCLLGTEVLINTGMMLGLLPITGLSLPLVSYGGSGMLAHAAALGILANIRLSPDYEVADEPFRFAADAA